MHRAVRCERDPGIGRARVIAAVGGVAAGAAREVRERARPGLTSVARNAGAEPVRAAVRPAILLPHADEVRLIARIHGDEWLDLGVAIEDAVTRGLGVAARRERRGPRHADRL